mmetsp:Transcript_27758/g.81195  ORF Transcript_27758/g.81195 Transcript_27758/m.81195 type:complete len:86 (-) Transcript_27758:881-1138(-)
MPPDPESGARLACADALGAGGHSTATLFAEGSVEATCRGTDELPFSVPTCCDTVLIPRGEGSDAEFEVLAISAEISLLNGHLDWS